MTDQCWFESIWIKSFVKNQLKILHESNRIFYLPEIKVYFQRIKNMYSTAAHGLITIKIRLMTQSSHLYNNDDNYQISGEG